MDCEPFLISSTLNLVIAQRLVRKFSGEKEKYKPTPAELKDIAKHCDLERVLQFLKDEKSIDQKADIKDIVFYKPKSSPGSTDGYRGRLGIFEILPITESLKNLIIKKANSDEITACAVKEGMRIMIEDGFVKAAQGLTSLEEVLRVITE